MDFTKLDGLVPAVIQDAESGEVLMVGFMNDTALANDKRHGVRDLLQPVAPEILDERRDLRQQAGCSRKFSSIATMTPCC